MTTDERYPLDLEHVLAQLSKHDIQIVDDRKNEEGYRAIQFRAALPSFPFAGQMRFATLGLVPGQTDVYLEQREQLKRQLGHLSTDIFGDDAAGYTELEKEDISEWVKDAPDPPPDEDPF